MQTIRRKHLKPGMLVEIIKNEKILKGTIKNVVPPHLSNGGIEVELTSGTVGLIHKIITKNEIEQATFKFYNLFFHSKHLLTIWNKYTKEPLILSSKNKRTKEIERSTLIFSEEVIAKKVLKELNREELAIRRISRQKPITENFTGDGITHYRLDESRRVNKKRLNQLEEQFTRF